MTDDKPEDWGHNDCDVCDEARRKKLSPVADVPVVVTREPWERALDAWARECNDDSYVGIESRAFEAGYTRGLIEGRLLALAAMGQHVRDEVLKLKTTEDNP